MEVSSCHTLPFLLPGCTCCLSHCPPVTEESGLRVAALSSPTQSDTRPGQAQERTPNMAIHLAELRRYKLFSREDIHIDSLIVPLQTSRSRRTSIKMVNINLHLHFLIPPT